MSEIRHRQQRAAAMLAYLLTTDLPLAHWDIHPSRSLQMLNGQIPKHTGSEGERRASVDAWAAHLDLGEPEWKPYTAPREGGSYGVHSVYAGVGIDLWTFLEVDPDETSNEPGGVDVSKDELSTPPQAEAVARG